MRLPPFLLALLFLIVTHTQAGSIPSNILLAIPFDDQPINQQIGLGGPSQGQPVSISPQLQAVVTPAGVLPTPSLRITPMATGAARYVVFTFLSDEEVSTGEVRIGFVIKPAQLDNFLINVRERDGAANNFATLRLTSGGSIGINDASNPGTELIGSYSAGASLVFELRFRMDEGLYDIYLNDAPIATDRAHGVATLGVGSVWIGSDSSTAVGASWFVDDVYVYRPLEVFDDGFE